MPSEKDKVELHNELLILLKKFDEICRDNNIKYSLHGGTMLGAIREKGFIPWDDDADVSITRDNFSKLKTLFSAKNKQGELYFDEQSGTAPMIWLKRKGKLPVWIDVFVYDYISEHFFIQKLKFIGLVFFLGFTKTDNRIKITANGEYKGIKWGIVYVLYLLGKLFPHKMKTTWKYNFAANWLLGNKKYMVRSNDQYKALKCIISHDAIKDYVMVPFEDTELMVHAGYDEILRSSYGDDYMTPVRMSTNAANAHTIIRKG